MLEKTVMKAKEAEHPEVFREPRPPTGSTPDAPPFFVLHGVNDTLVPVEMARTFVERLRAVSRQPVAYAELPLAQHAFDVLASLRCQATTSAVADFLEGARARRRTAGRRRTPTAGTFGSDVESETGPMTLSAHRARPGGGRRSTVDRGGSGARACEWSVARAAWTRRSSPDRALRGVLGGSLVAGTARRRRAACAGCAGDGRPAGAASRPPSGTCTPALAPTARPRTRATTGITAKSVTVGNVSIISGPVPGLFEGAPTGVKAYFAMHQFRRAA